MAIFVYCRHIYGLTNVLDLHPSSSPVFGGSVLLISFRFLGCPIMCIVPYVDVRDDFRIKIRCSVCLYLQLFVGGPMSYLRYLYLFAYIGVKHILLCFLFCLSSSCVLCTLCYKFLWIVHFLLPLRYSLMFIATWSACVIVMCITHNKAVWLLWLV